MSWPQLAVIPVLSLLLLVHELGHFIVARMVGIRVEEFGFGLPPRIWGVKRGEVIYSVNWIPLGAFVRMTGENGENNVDERSFGNKRKLARSAVLVAGPAMNFLAGALLFAAAFMVGSPTPAQMDIFVAKFSPGSPAQAAGLQTGDQILALNGQKLDVVGQFIDGTRARLGQQITVTVVRGGKQVDLKMTPRTQWPEGDGPLGIGLESKNVVNKLVDYPFYQAVPMGLGQAMQAVQLTFSVPAMVIQGILPADEARPTGPIGIYRITTDAADQIAASGWWYPLISITALVSVGLAVANLLPFPALDGGRLLMVGVEAVRRKKISPEREGAIHFAGLMVLITLMMLISYYDVISPLPSINWGFR
jgi:regulator of sigma E protease